MKPRKLTKTIKKSMELSREQRATKRLMRKESRNGQFGGMTVSFLHECHSTRSIRSLDTGSNSTAKVGIMNERWKESPEVRHEIERKSRCLAPAYNKGAVQYIADEESAKWVGRK